MRIIKRTRGTMRGKIVNKFKTLVSPVNQTPPAAEVVDGQDLDVDGVHRNALVLIAHHNGGADAGGSDFRVTLNLTEARRIAGRLAELGLLEEAQADA